MFLLFNKLHRRLLIQVLALLTCPCGSGSFAPIPPSVRTTAATTAHTPTALGSGDSGAKLRLWRLRNLPKATRRQAVAGSGEDTGRVAADLTCTSLTRKALSSPWSSGPKAPPLPSVVPPVRAPYLPCVTSPFFLKFHAFSIFLCADSRFFN